MREIILKVARVVAALSASIACFLVAWVTVIEGFTAGGIGVILFAVFLGSAFALAGAFFALMALVFWTDY